MTPDQFCLELKSRIKAAKNRPAWELDLIKVEIGTAPGSYIVHGPEGHFNTCARLVSDALPVGTEVEYKTLVHPIDTIQKLITPAALFSMPNAETMAEKVLILSCDDQFTYMVTMSGYQLTGRGFCENKEAAAWIMVRMGFTPEVQVAPTDKYLAALRCKIGIEDIPQTKRGLELILRAAITTSGATQEDRDLLQVQETGSEMIVRCPSLHLATCVAAVDEIMSDGFAASLNVRYLPVDLHPGVDCFACHRCQAVGQMDRDKSVEHSMEARGWRWAIHVTGQELIGFCPLCTAIVDAARQILEAAMKSTHELQIGEFFFGPPPKVSTIAVMGLPMYLVVRKQDDQPAEVLPFAEEFPARELFQYMSQNWTDTYLCAVISGPGRPIPGVIDGLGAIAAARRRQLSSGFDAAHDQEHAGGELAWAAACLAAPGPILVQREQLHEKYYTDPYPFTDWDKRADWPRVQLLAHSGAFCAAEIDRLLKGGQRTALGEKIAITHSPLYGIPIKPELRPGLPSAADRAAHGAGRWLAREADRPLQIVGFCDDGMWVSGVFYEYSAPSHTAQLDWSLWSFCPIDADGNKISL